jgi:hypothetical protein
MSAIQFLLRNKWKLSVSLFIIWVLLVLYSVALLVAERWAKELYTRTMGKPFVPADALITEKR